MSDSSKAVFLSYASQDAPAALRICEALRTAGVEVWFDQSELRGGDAWDAKIRKQIKECALFVPIISTSTQRRHEGYFRLEWHLAEQRSHLIARGRPFIIPVSVDDTRDADALVPDAFLAVQWTRLPGGEATPAFCTRVREMLAGERKPAGPSSVAPPVEPPAPPAATRPAKRRAVWPWVVVALAALFVAREIFKPRRSPEDVAKLLAQVQSFAAQAEKITSPPEAVPAPVTPPKVAPAAAPAAEEKSVAVLAFDNLSDDKANEYFSDGISEELLNALAKIPGLKVTARTSSFYFKGKNLPVAEIARQLGVAYIVEGSVRKAGAKVRIAAQLIQAATGFEVWSDHFDRELTDVFAVQEEIAGLIAQNFQLKLDTAARVDKPVNPEAHQLYLQGKYLLNQFTLDGTARATGLLQRAVELDPSFTPAWVALSRAGVIRGGYGSTKQDVEEGFALARRAAERALTLDPGAAEAHVAISDVQVNQDFDWKGAAESLRRAEALAPTDPYVIDSLAGLAYTFGQLDRAIALGAQAVALDPVNPAVRVSYGFSLSAAGKFPEAEAEFRRIVELNPAAPWGHAGLSFNFIIQGRYDQAAAESARETNEWSRLFTLAMAQWGQGKTAASDATLAQLIKSFGDVAAYQIAEAYAFRRDSDHTFEWLERAYRQRDPGLAWLRPDPFVNRLRPDPRLDSFVRKLGLADDQVK